MFVFSLGLVKRESTVIVSTPLAADDSESIYGLYGIEIHNICQGYPILDVPCSDES